MLDGHNRMAEEHFLLPALHNLQEVVRETFAEAGRLALFADGFADSVGATVNLEQDGRQDGGALGAKFVVGRAVVRVAIFAEGLADIFFLIWNIIFQLGLLALGQEAFDLVEYSHKKSPFKWR